MGPQHAFASHERPDHARAESPCRTRPSADRESGARIPRRSTLSVCREPRMINKLVLENLRHRWVRTLLSALVIGVQVMSILTLIGLSRGLLQESATRQKGTGADIFLKPDNGAGTVSLGTGQTKEAFVALVAKQPHVAQALGVLGQPTSELFTSVQGVNFPELEKMSGGIAMVAGHIPTDP